MSSAGFASSRWSTLGRRHRTTNRCLRLEQLEPRNLLTANVVISELVASNVGGLIDFQGKDSDWFELHNRDTEPVDLEGWYATDDPDQLTQWRFTQSHVLQPDDRIVVHASQQDLVDPQGVFHTNFELNTSGEFLALVDPQGNVVDSFSPAYPPQATNVSYGIAESLPGRIYSFSDTPTPGSANALGQIGVSQPPTFSEPGGTFPQTEPLTVLLSTELAGGAIRYTIDRSLPTETSPLYTAPIPISQSTQVRARVFHPERVPSEVTSETYVALHDEVLDFDSNLPIVVLENFGQQAPLDRVFRNGFAALFEPDATGRSRLTNQADLTSRIGMHRRGNSTFSRSKINWRIEFRDEWNEDRNVEPFGLPADADFTLLPPYLTDRALLRNAFMFELSRQLGRWAARTRFVEVYSNIDGNEVTQADYQGLYLLTERIEIGKDRVDIQEITMADNTEPNLTGGYIFKAEQPRCGTCVPSDALTTSSQGISFTVREPNSKAITQPQRQYLIDYLADLEAALYGPDFQDPVLGYTPWIDVPSFVDEHMLRFFSGEVDFFIASLYFHKDRNGPLKMTPIWDFNQAAMSDGRSVAPDQFTELFERQWFERLFEDPDFSQAWVERWQELRRDVLTEANITQILYEMAEQISEAQARNFARWPEVAPNGGFFAQPGHTGWEAEVSHLRNFFVVRLRWLDTQMLDPVTFNRRGGSVPLGFPATLTAPQGTVYYTLDGSDPRTAGGGISAQAIKYTDQAITIDKATRILARTHNPAGGKFHLQHWSSLSTAEFFIDHGLVVSEIQYNPHDADPSRDELAVDNDAFEFIELTNRGAAPVELEGLKLVQLEVEGVMQGIDFVFADQTLHPDERIVVVADRAAFESRYGAQVRLADGNDGLGGTTGSYADRLANRGERLTLINHLGIPILSFDYDDNPNWPQRADGLGSSLELSEANADLHDPTSWRNSIQLGGSPGAVGVDGAGGVIINEVLTNTPGPVDDAIELYNPTGLPIDVGGFWLSDTFAFLDRYVIPAGNVVPAGGYLVLGQDDFGFGLDGTRGESVILVQPGTPPLFVDHVTFGPALPHESFGHWPDGTGELISMSATSLGATNSEPRIGPIVISEVMYHPPVDVGTTFDHERLEFVEIYNPTAHPVDLTGWELEGIGYHFATGTTIGPGQTRVLVPFSPREDTTRMAAFEQSYGVDLVANGSGYLGPYPGRLDNGGEPLTLRRTLGDPAAGILTVEDQVIYDDAAPWPVTPDGTGLSLQRVSVDLPGSTATNWIDGTPNPGRMQQVKTIAMEDTATVIGEVGQVTELTHATHTIKLSRDYLHPIVFAQPASYEGLDTSILRVSAVESDQFDLSVVEPSNLNGLHNAGETASYLVLEAGSHWLSNGAHLEVGTVTTRATVGRQVTSPSWEMVHFTDLFAATPAVLSQLQTFHGDPFLDTRHNHITHTGFDVALQGEERMTSASHPETIGYLAIDQGLGTWNGMNYEAASTGLFFVGETFLPARFDQFFREPPNVLASLDSYESDDNAHLRFKDVNYQFVTLLVEEDTTQDAEQAHPSESVAYIAIEGTGPLTATSTRFTESQASQYPINIANAGHIADVNVTLDLVHGRLADLDVFLESPHGTLVELFNEVGSEENALAVIVLDDQATASITATSAPFSGRFTPAGNLSDFNGGAITGTWTLHVADRMTNAMRGALLAWSLELTLAPDPTGNLNSDRQLDALDIDLLYANLGSADPIYDLDGDHDADRQDVQHLVEDILGKRFGDSNLDQRIDMQDINILRTNFDPFGTGVHSGWSRGDFDGDGDFDISDFRDVVLHYAPLGYASTAANQTHGIPITVRRDADANTTPLGISVEIASATHVARPLARNDVTSTIEHWLVDDSYRSRRVLHRQTQKHTTDHLPVFDDLPLLIEGQP